MITTIITTYKRPQLLKRALESVLKQTFTDFQVCVYDNASGDETEEIMKEFVKNDSRVKYHKHPENIGMMKNYEFAISRINTPYFSLLSDDDFFLPWFYETALNGFNQYPDAALSICGVLAVDENKELRSEPLSFWKREGFYEAPSGMLEMLGGLSHFPIPTSILFQHSKVKDITPDYRKEIQPRWDSDYLLQISSRHPIVINKKPCGIFLVHSSSFSTTFFNEAFESSNGLDRFLLATNKVLEKLINSPFIDPIIKKKIKVAFISMMEADISIHMKYFIMKKQFILAYKTSSCFYNNYGFNKKIFLLHLWGFFSENCPIIKPVFRKIRSMLVSMKNSFSKKEKMKVIIEANPNSKYQEYLDWITPTNN